MKDKNPEDLADLRGWAGRVVSCQPHIEPAHQETIDHYQALIGTVTDHLIRQGCTRREILEDPVRNTLIKSLVEFRLVVEQPRYIVEVAQ